MLTFFGVLLLLKCTNVPRKAKTNSGREVLHTPSKFESNVHL